MFIEEIPLRFAALLKEAWSEGAELFAADLAVGGSSPSSLHYHADEWDRAEFDPPAFSNKLRELADQIESLDN